MSKFSLPHFNAKLLETGCIDERYDPELYHALLQRIDEINETLAGLTRRVVVDRVLGVATMVSIPEDELEALSEEQDTYPVTPIAPRSTLSLYESVIAIYFRAAYADALRSQSVEWEDEDQILEALAGKLPHDMQHDEALSRARLRPILKKLANFNLIDIKEDTSGTYYRASRQIVHRITQTDCDRFERRLRARSSELSEQANQDSQTANEPVLQSELAL